MQRMTRTATAWLVAGGAAVLGLGMVIFGSGHGLPALGWLEFQPYWFEAFDLLGAVFSSATGVFGVGILTAGLVGLAFLAGRHRRRTDVAQTPRNARGDQLLTVARWTSAVVIAIGLVFLNVGLNEPQPIYSYRPIPQGVMYATPIPDPGILLRGVVIYWSALIGAAITLAGLLPAAYLIGRHGVGPLSATRSSPAT